MRPKYVPAYISIRGSNKSWDDVMILRLSGITRSLRLPSTASPIRNTPSIIINIREWGTSAINEILYQSLSVGQYPTAAHRRQKQSRCTNLRSTYEP